MKRTLSIKTYIPRRFPGEKIRAFRLPGGKYLIYQKKEQGVFEALGFRYSPELLIIDTDDVFDEFIAACLRYHKDWSRHGISKNTEKIYEEIIDGVQQKDYEMTPAEIAFTNRKFNMFLGGEEWTQNSDSELSNLYKIKRNAWLKEQANKRTDARHRFIEIMGGLWE